MVLNRAGKYGHCTECKEALQVYERKTKQCNLCYSKEMAKEEGFKSSKSVYIVENNNLYEVC